MLTGSVNGKTVRYVMIDRNGVTPVTDENISIYTRKTTVDYIQGARGQMIEVVRGMETVNGGLAGLLTTDNADLRSIVEHAKVTQLIADITKLRSALTAPLSSTTRPPRRKWSASHCFLATVLICSARKCVPIASPAASLTSTSCSLRARSTELRPSLQANLLAASIRTSEIEETERQRKGSRWHGLASTLKPRSRKVLAHQPHFREVRR